MEFRKWPLARAIYLRWPFLSANAYIYKHTALLGPNVCLFGAHKVALPQQLEEIGSICSLCWSADISSHLGGLGDVCWEIKQALRSQRSAEADQRFALFLVLVTPLSCLGYKHSARKADSKSVFEILSTVSTFVTPKDHDFWRKAWAGQSCLLIRWFDYCECVLFQSNH